MAPLETNAKTASYTGAREDVLALISPASRLMLDVGCATGALGGAVKRRQGAQVVGIEYDERTAAEARQHLDLVITADLSAWPTIQAALSGRQFDTIVCADVLEHLNDPWSLLPRLKEHLRPGGEMIISLPNVGHHNTLWCVFVRRRFPRRDRGLHDATHLRWFARRDVLDLALGAGLTVHELRRSYRLTERSSGINRFARYLAAPGVRDLLTYQFLLRATR